MRQTLPLRSPFGFTVPVQSTCSSRKIRTMSRSNAYYKDNGIMRQIQVSAHSLVLPNDIGVTIDPGALPPRLCVKEIHPSGRSLARMHHLLIFYPHSLSRPAFGSIDSSQLFQAPPQKGLLRMMSVFALRKVAMSISYPSLPLFPAFYGMNEDAHKILSVRPPYDISNQLGFAASPTDA